MGTSSNKQRVIELCGLIESSEQEPSLDTLAAHLGLSTFYTQRIFKEATGVTPKEYARAQRAGRIRKALSPDTPDSAAASITSAFYEAGYQSSGRFYEESNQILGMTPSQVRQGGRGLTIRFAVGQCSLGAILVAATRVGVCAILLGDDPHKLLEDLAARFSEAELLGGDGAFESLVARVVGFVEQPWKPLDLPLHIRGTAFQELVWKALRRVPAGETVSYSELAKRLGRPNSARAVAGACAANPLAVAIPCHRVVRSDGGLSGYRWGIERKSALLARERQQERDGA